jgi:hypothetical protein
MRDLGAAVALAEPPAGAAGGMLHYEIATAADGGSVIRLAGDGRRPRDREAQ